MIKSPSTVMSYYGSKYKLAKHYPKPKHKKIIEPFAGGAGYSLRHSEYEVHLYDLNEKVCGVWDFMIRSTPQEILSLPLLAVDETVDSLPDHLPQEAKWLIGFWLNYAVTSPRKSFSSIAKKKLERNSSAVWSERRRLLLSQTVTFIKHWKVTHASYDLIPNQQATWFIDPPYAGNAGRHYIHDSIDFNALADWCKEREGQVIVCENSDSPLWLPFTHFKETSGAFQTKSGSKKTEEVWWTNTGEHIQKKPEQVSIFDFFSARPPAPNKPST